MSGRSRRHFGSIRKLPSGRYQASYWHEGALRTADMTFDTSNDANAWLSKTQTAVLSGSWIDPKAGRMTIRELSELWLASNSRKRSSTLARDRSILSKHVLPVIGKRRLLSVKRHDVQSLVDRWTEAPSTVGRQYATVRALFAFAEATDRLARTPCRGIRLPHIPLVDRPELGSDDLEALARALPPNQATMMWCGAVLGLRWAEAAGLTVSVLDLLNREVTVTHQLGRDGDLGPPKSDAGRRTIACPTWLADDLAAVLRRRGVTAADADALVFVSPDGRPLRYTNWRRRVWRPATIAAKMPALRFHDLRSTAATALVSSGVDVKTAQRRLGHSSARMTLDLYARATAAADRSAADAVGELLRPNRLRDERGL